MQTTLERELYIWEKNHIELCENAKFFLGKDVLEVGGTTPQGVVKRLNPKSWTCIDTWGMVNLDSQNYRVINANIATLDLESNSFDFIYSTNAFEHISDLKSGIQNMKRMLRNGGYLSTIFGPIWSSSKGHHLWAFDQNKNLHTFNDELIPHWGHLLCSQDEVRELLSKTFSEPYVVAIMRTIYEQNTINHLFYEDYKEIIEGSGLEVIEFNDWHSPIIPDGETLNLLKENFGDRNFSTISIRCLLRLKD